MQNWKDRYEAKLTKPWLKKYFSYRGRLNRKPYILRSLVLSLIFNLFFAFGNRNVSSCFAEWRNRFQYLFRRLGTCVPSGILFPHCPPPA